VQKTKQMYIYSGTDMLRSCGLSTKICLIRGLQ